MRRWPERAESGAETIEGQMLRRERLRILIATDAWEPQVNGVVRTLQTLERQLAGLGHEVRFVTPAAHPSVALPSYPEVRLALFAGRRVEREIRQFDPDSIHIATEGPIGLAARRICIRRGIPFTTSFHTKFPDYIEARTLLPAAWTYPVFRWFHQPARRIMVATASLESELQQHGFANLRRWSRGVDTALFRPRSRAWLDLPRPVWLYVGRVAVEKNIASFLALDLPGTKLVVGDGPQLGELRVRFPGVRFTGALKGEELARHYAAADVFVFPSKTDTFGLVVLEALASGVPVAAFAVQGPLDILGRNSDAGCLHDDLRVAAMTALGRDPAACRRRAMGFSWEACTQQFLGNLAWRTA